MLDDVTEKCSVGIYCVVNVKFFIFIPTGSTSHLPLLQREADDRCQIQQHHTLRPAAMRLCSQGMMPTSCRRYGCCQRKKQVLIYRRSTIYHLKSKVYHASPCFKVRQKIDVKSLILIYRDVKEKFLVRCGHRTLRRQILDGRRKMLDDVTEKCSI